MSSARASAATPDTGNEYVKLVSADGYEFYVSRRCATVSRTVQSMLNSDFVEAHRGEVRFADIEGALLELVLDYCYYYRQCERGVYGGPSGVPTFPVPLNSSLRLLSVANYLDV